MLSKFLFNSDHRLKKSFVLIALVSAFLMIGMAVSCGNSGGSEEKVRPVSDDDISSEEPADVSLSDVSIQLGKGITRKIDAVGGSNIQWSSSDDSVASVDSEGNVTGIKLGNCVLTAVNEYGNSAECAVTVKKTCYLTFDDGPKYSIYDILDVLKEYDAKATFFLVDTVCFSSVERMKNEGHALALHTRVNKTSHCYRTLYRYYDDLEKLNDKLEEYTGVRSNLIRFPGGSSNTVCEPLRMRRLLNGADDLGYRVFDWTASSKDTRPGSDYLTSSHYVLSECNHDVEIVLMHDLNFTANALRIILPALQSRGYVFETLDHYPEHTYQHKCKYSWNHPDLPSESVSLSKETVELKTTEKFELEAAMTPIDSTDYIIWESSDSSVASVSLSGVVVGVSEGEATVTAKTSSGKTASCKVTVISAAAE